MPSLKALRTRIASVKSTQKITSAMKMVAASKLRRAQQQAEAARPYAERMDRMVSALSASVAGSPTAPQLLIGTGRDKVHLLIAVTADRAGKRRGASVRPPPSGPATQDSCRL
jgi:F-type H+-transporting ATPase subunit gamma